MAYFFGPPCTYVYFTTKVDITENIKKQHKIREQMQTTDCQTEKERNKDYYIPSLVCIVYK